LRIIAKALIEESIGPEKSARVYRFPLTTTSTFASSPKRVPSLDAAGDGGRGGSAVLVWLCADS
jgi:hypothetical protein